MSPIRVILADDHVLPRAGIRSLLEEMDGIEVVAEASDGPQALDLIGRHQPDVVCTDISMPGMNGLELTERVTKEFPEVNVLILSMHDNEEYVLQALRAGALGYLLKAAQPDELEFAIRAVALGGSYLTPSVSRRTINNYVTRTGTEASPLELLTARQRETLLLIAEGYSTKAIAGKMSISTKTVESYRVQLMDRLDIHDIAGLVRFAIRVGLVSSEK